ncbi:hypothetical protein EV177_010976, partial [Coemansia sp. RSA 1804]
MFSAAPSHATRSALRREPSVPLGSECVIDLADDWYSECFCATADSSELSVRAALPADARIALSCVSISFIQPLASEEDPDPEPESDESEDAAAVVAGAAAAAVVEGVAATTTGVVEGVAATTATGVVEGVVD